MTTTKMMATSVKEIPIGAKVQFTQERLFILTRRDRLQLEGRVGLVEGYRYTTNKPTVSFEPDGKRETLRLFNVDARQLEIVSLPEPEGELPIDAPQEGEKSVAQELQDDSQRKLSQDELDNMFD